MNTDFTTKECPECLGARQLTFQVRDFGGRDTFETEIRECEVCNGEGRVNADEEEAVEATGEEIAA